MKRVFDQAAERDVYEELTIPAGEFVALLMSALMLLGLFFGSSTLPEGTKTIVADMVATLSHASASLGVWKRGWPSTTFAISRYLH